MPLNDNQLVKDPPRLAEPLHCIKFTLSNDACQHTYYRLWFSAAQPTTGCGLARNYRISQLAVAQPAAELPLQDRRHRKMVRGRTPFTLAAVDFCFEHLPLPRARDPVDPRAARAGRLEAAAGAFV